MDTFSFASDLWDDFHWDVTTDTSMDGSFEVLPDLPGFGQGDADGQDFNSSFIVPDNGQWFTNSPLDIVTTKAAPSFPIDDIILGDAFLGPIFPVPSEAAGGQQLAATDLTLWHSPMANEGLTEDHIVRSSLQHTPYRIGHQDIRTMNPGPPEQAVEPLRPSRAKRARSPETATCDRASKKLQFTTCEKRLQDEQVQIQPGMFCFNANPDVPVPLVVERLSLERKKEIKEMRSVGACLSCKMQKKSCSAGAPCERCNKAQTATRAFTTVWSRLECTRMTLLDLPVFQNKIASSPRAPLIQDMLESVAHRNVTLKFDIPFSWDIKALSEYVSKWITTCDRNAHCSLVGIMSSSPFFAIMEQSIGKQLAIALKVFINSTSTLRVCGWTYRTFGRDWNQDLDDLSVVAGAAGVQMIALLDKKLAPRALGALPTEEKLALYIGIVGAIIATKYYRDAVGAKAGQPAHEKGVAGELIRLLTYYLLIVGKRCVVEMNATQERVAIDGAPDLWQKRASWSWIAPSDDEDDEDDEVESGCELLV